VLTSHDILAYTCYKKNIDENEIFFLIFIFISLIYHGGSYPPINLLLVV
jgi:hypothetical protein